MANKWLSRLIGTKLSEFWVGKARFLSSALAANRAFTLPDKDGTVAMLSDILEASVEAKTGDYSVTSGDSGKTFTNEGAGAKPNFTLPSAAVNLTYKFYARETVGLRITAATGDTLRYGENESASAGYLETTTQGSALTIEAINETEWIVFFSMGLWDIN